MSDIMLSKAVRSNLLSLQNTAQMMSRTQERLATGLKVNSALDNPTNFFTAQGLNSRANDLSRLLDGVSNATQTLAAADNGISAITKLVESAQATARQALQTSATVQETTNVAATAGRVTAGAFSTDGVDVSTAGTPSTAATITAGEFTGPVDLSNGGDDDGSITFDIAVDGGPAQTITINDAAVTAFNAVPANADNQLDASSLSADDIASLINAQLTGATASVNDDGDIVFTSGTTGDDSSLAISNFAVANGATGSGIGDEAIVNGVTGDPSAVISFDISVNGGDATTVTIDAAAVAQYNTDNDASLDASALSAADVVALINDQVGSSVASVNDAGNIQFSGTGTGTTSTVTISNFSATEEVEGSTGIANGTGAGAAASSTTANVVNPKRAEFVQQYNDLRQQIDDLAKDAGFNGVNLLNGDNLSVIFNEGGSSKLDIQGATFDAAGLGITELDSDAFDSDAGVNAVLGTLDNAASDLRTQASKFGSNLSVVKTREDFTKKMIDTLQTGAANLTLADTNQEGANLLALQTRQSLSSTALSLASQADQNVLRLL